MNTPETNQQDTAAPGSVQPACSAETIALIEERIRADLDYAAMQIRLRYYDRAWPYLNNATTLKRDLDALRQNARTERQPPGEAVARSETSQTTQDAETGKGAAVRSSDLVRRGKTT